MLAISIADCVALINSALGLDLTKEELVPAALRSYNFEKAFNTIHADFKREDDYLPERYLEEPAGSCSMDATRRHRDRPFY